MSAVRTELILSALGAAAQVAMAKHGQRHEQSMLELRNGALKDMTDALITRRVEAVKEGFAAVLADYAAQAQHFMAQQAKYADAHLVSADPLVRVELNQRLRDIDIELGRIRTDAQLLYARMTDVIVMLGGVDLRFGNDLAAPLALPCLPGGLG